jgi:hypothetical protein
LGRTGRHGGYALVIIANPVGFHRLLSLKKSRATAAVYALLGQNRLVEINEAWEPVGTRTGRRRGNGEAALGQIGSKWAFFEKARAMVLQYRTSPVGARLTAAGQRLKNQMGTKPML